MSIDPFITFPDNGQSFNPYSYVMNNPLKYTDPSGYKPKSSYEKCQEDPNCTNVIKKTNDDGMIAVENSISITWSDGTKTKLTYTTYVPYNSDIIPTIGSTTNKGKSEGNKGYVNWQGVILCKAQGSNCFDIRSWIYSKDAKSLANYEDIKWTYEYYFRPDGGVFWDRQRLANSLVPTGLGGSKTMLMGLKIAAGRPWQYISHRGLVPNNLVKSIENVNKAVVPVKKFSAYIFKEGATHGKDVIFRGLGYSVEHSSQLAKTFQSQGAKLFASGDFTAGGMIIKNGVNHGQRITININLKGIGAYSSKSVNIKTGWTLRSDGSISLSTPFSGFVK